MNKYLTPGQSIRVQSRVGFYDLSNLDENIAQSDTATFSLEFTLSQKKVNP